jgi:CRP-like cAMP-binding protein
VEILSGGPRQNAANSTVLSTLKAGDYFGHVTRPSLECQLRARTQVRLLVIARHAADALSEVRPDLALLLKQGAGAAGSQPCSVLKHP